MRERDGPLGADAEAREQRAHLCDDNAVAAGEEVARALDAREVGGPALRRLTFHERAAILKALAKALGDKGLAGDDVVGYVFAVNGKINSADLYPSNALFRKMWRKNFDASVTSHLQRIRQRLDASI